MFLTDEIPIICKIPKGLQFVDLFFIHDVHCDKMYILRLFGEEKKMETIGFYP